MTTPHPFTALPLGGIGTGNLALAADGSLKQWQLHNIGNHTGTLPGSFFALRISQWEPPFNEQCVLIAQPGEPHEPTVLVNDDDVPTWQRDLLEDFSPMASASFEGHYPFGTVTFDDDTLPVKVTLDAFTPLIPLNEDDSALPAALFTFTFTNTDPKTGLNGWLGAGLQNAIGHDGMTNPVGVHSPRYGGNVNTVHRADGWTELTMTNPSLNESAPRDPGAGTMSLSVSGTRVSSLPQWTDPAQFMDFMATRQPVGPDEWNGVPDDLPDPQPNGITARPMPSPSGSTWNGGVVSQFFLEPGETTTVRVAITWHFPNRYVNFVQFGGVQPTYAPATHWLGNRYTTRWSDASQVTAYVHENWDTLEHHSRAWVDAMTNSDLADEPGGEVADRMLTQAAIVRSPSYFQSADDRTFAFEGVLGASTPMWAGFVGGSCPLNCTHVHAYAQATAKLFPRMERSMRETEFTITQAPEGFIPHRVLLPLETPQIWDREIGGPGDPALDGMLSIVLRTYREARYQAGSAWLEQYWPNLVRLMDYIENTWDPDSTGLLHGIQPSTHDIDLCGINSYMGTYWLAALRAMEEISKLLGDDERASHYRERFEASSRAYDEALFTGEYYRQVLEEGDRDDFQWKDGCLSDQLIGQWWAHQLDLGYLLPRDHVVTALKNVVRLNLRTGFDDFEHPYRSFATGKETGLLMCSWPTGGRPDVPTRYCDEVWTGIEYQVAAHCLHEGLIDEGYTVLHGLWARYDGTTRNPYNEIECGDHYTRALSGWSVFDELTGITWNQFTGELRIAREPRRSLVVMTGTGWGTLTRDEGGLTLTCLYGTIDATAVTVADTLVASEGVNISAGESAKLSAAQES